MTVPIVIPEVKKTLHDYNVVFSTGIGVSYTIDPAIGDTIHFTPDTIIIHLVAKTTPGSVRPEEDTTLYVQHIASVHKLTREEVALTPEETHAWKTAWDELTKP